MDSLHSPDLPGEGHMSIAELCFPTKIQDMDSLEEGLPLDTQRQVLSGMSHRTNAGLEYILRRFQRTGVLRPGTRHITGQGIVS